MRVISCLLVLLVASTASAQRLPERLNGVPQDATAYRDLRASRPDGRTIPVKRLILERDAYRLTLESGAVHLLAPLGRDTFGAVFIGQGSYLLNPATPAERRHLQLVAGAKDVLTDRFSKLILLFTDKTAAEVLAHAPVATGAPDPAAVRAYEDYLNRQRDDVLPNLHLRVLADLLNRPARTDGVFLAFVEGQNHSPVLLAIDPLGVSNLTPRFSFYGGEEVVLFSFNNQNSGLWYSSTFAPQAKNGRGKPVRMLADASHYDIDTTLDGGALRGTTTVTFTPNVDGIRVLPIELFQRLRIRAATIDRAGAAVPVAVLQESGTAPEVAVQFSEPLSRGVAVKLTFTYEGRDVLQGAEGRYSVGARDSWFPNVGILDDLATYSMTFRFSAKNDLIAVGEQVSERTEGGQKIAVWRSERPIRVAGFNYGDFQKVSRVDEQGGVAVDVHVLRGPEYVAMAGTPLADAVNTVRVGNQYFGPSPFPRMAITQQVQLASAQSWPTLIFLSTISFVGGSDLAMGFQGLDPRALQSLKEFGNTVTWHEVAHQWWGHQVGWSNYRDQWLSEGLAEFTSALMLEVNSGRKKADAFWAERRSEVLGRTTGVPNAEAGAITQGFRLGSPRSPGAARAMLYSKGAFVVHMLRMVMREEGAPDPDRPFKAMMADFVKTWSGRNPSTDDFKAIAEKHITRDLNLAGDGKLDYFFDQWVHGTDIPTLTSSIQATDLGNGRYRIAGTITQSGVPAEFRTRVPIYIDFGDDRVALLGSIALTGATTQKVSVERNLPQKPRRVVINAHYDVLSR
ncbi:MAG TPA: M1 family aminopeptidase [Vicinamibacterales bacterium]|nr:M1 family aminopeptidase [Vicinamibacterales bacterium]